MSPAVDYAVQPFVEFARPAIGPAELAAVYADRLGVARGMFPNAEFVSDRTLSLPFTAGLSDAEVSRVIEALRELLAR